MLTACLAQPLAGQATDSLASARRVVAAASLAAKEYALGVTPAGGQIVQPEEVDEAKLFIQQAQFDVPSLPTAARVAAGEALTRLGGMLDRLAPPDSVRLAVDHLVSRVTAAAGGPKVIEQLPARAPSLERGAVVFRERCAECHGESGRGDGPKARQLKGPPPANLTDPATMGGTTQLEIFRRIAIGVPGTAMPEFADDISVEDRWAVAAYVGAICRRPAPGRLRAGAALRENRVRRLSHVRAGRDRCPGQKRRPRERPGDDVRVAADARRGRGRGRAPRDSRTAARWPGARRARRRGSAVADEFVRLVLFPAVA